MIPKLFMEIIRVADASVQGAAQRAALALAAGSLIIYPTDTLYGLGIDPENGEALARLRRVKMRESKKPISIIVPDIDSIEQYAELGTAERSFAEQFFPGALTLVVPAKPNIPAEITLNGMIGIRIPADPFSLELSRAYGKPFTATSANKSGYQTPSTVPHILEQFGSAMEHIALAVFDGERAGNTPSTVVTFINSQPYILREGALKREDLGL